MYEEGLKLKRALGLMIALLWVISAYGVLAQTQEDLPYAYMSEHSVDALTSLETGEWLRFEKHFDDGIPYQYVVKLNSQFEVLWEINLDLAGPFDSYSENRHMTFCGVNAVGAMAIMVIDDSGYSLLILNPDGSTNRRIDIEKHLAWANVYALDHGIVISTVHENMMSGRLMYLDWNGDLLGDSMSDGRGYFGVLQLEHGFAAYGAMEGGRFIERYDEQLNLQWTYCCSSPYGSRFTKLIVDINGDVIALASEDTPDAQRYSVLLKLSAQGALLWTRRLDVPESGLMMDLYETDSGYRLLGADPMTGPFPTQLLDMYVDNEGEFFKMTKIALPIGRPHPPLFVIDKEGNAYTYGLIQNESQIRSYCIDIEKLGSYYSQINMQK